jgi:exonuclease SbcD
MLTIAHCADIHLDDRAHCAGTVILDSQGRNIRGEDRRRCFRAFAEGAIARGVDLAIIAGDLYEHNKPWPSEECAATEVLDQLCARIPVLLLADNHGNAESATERHAIEPLIGRNPLRLLVSTRPELLTVSTRVGDVQICTLPSPRRSIVAAKDEYRGLIPGALNALICDKLRTILRGFRSQLDPTLPAILAYHGGIQGAWLTELQQATGTGEIRLNPEDLDGFDYVALGDYHGFQMVTPRACYSGSTDRCSANEEGQTKGWLHVELSDDRELFPVVHLVETPARRFMTLEPGQLRDKALLERLEGEPLAELPVVRVKGQVTQEEADQLQPYLTVWRQLPTFSEQLEITRETRARSAEMTGELTPEASLRLWHQTNSRPDDLGALLAAHRALAGAAR